MTAPELTAALQAYHSEAAFGVVRTQRYRLAYSAWGDGPPLVLIHGLNDIPRSFVPLMMYLKRDFRCWTLALPEGHADGAMLHDYHHCHYSLDLVAFLDACQLSRVDLLGSSFGSTIALRTAAEFPALVRKVILQGGFARRPLNPVERGLAHLGRSWPWRMGQLPLRPRIMRVLEAPAFTNAPAMLPFLLANSAETPIRACTHRARILATLDLRSLLPAIPHDILMIGGDRDRIVPRQYEAEVETGAGNVKRIEFAHCSHYPQYTHTGEMAKAMRKCLKG